MENRLYRNPQGAMLGGVCQGLGEYLRIDPTWVRIFFVLLAIASGVGLLIYFILWILLPPLGTTTSNFAASDFGDRARMVGDDIRTATTQGNNRLPQFLGIGLIIVGGFALLRALPIPWLDWFHDVMLWPILLILGGGVLLIRAFRKE
jgi:phage shock protein PspC (stress-responsive transcriptional regulator)